MEKREEIFVRSMTLFTESVGLKEQMKLRDYVMSLSEHDLDEYNKLTKKLIERLCNGQDDGFRITNNSIKLCLKIRKDTNFFAYPLVRRLYGTTFPVKYNLMLPNLNGNDSFKSIYSQERMIDLLKSNNKIKMDITGHRLLVLYL